MEQEILKNVVALAERVQYKMMERETEIESSITEEDMNEYLEQVIREVRKHNSGFS
jgi:hypothetical protein